MNATDNLIKKYTDQKAKVSAKVAEINELRQQKADLFNEDGSYSREMLDPICDMITKVNRAEGVLKRMVKRAIELYYLISDIKYDASWMDSEYEFAGQYLRQYNKTFGARLSLF